jgi:hypothetical protein
MARVDGSRWPRFAVPVVALVLAGLPAQAEDRVSPSYVIVRAPQGPVAGKCLIKGKVRGSKAELNKTTVFVLRARVRDEGVLLGAPTGDDEGTVLTPKGEFELPMDGSGPHSLIIESGNLSLQALVAGCGLEIEASVAQGSK